MTTILQLEMRGQLDDLRRWLQQSARSASPDAPMESTFHVAMFVYFGRGGRREVGKGLRRWAWAEFKRTWLSEACDADKTGKL